MATQLSLYNGALRHLGQRRLASISEDREARYYLDDEYTDTFIYCLRQGFWNFAMRVVQIDAEATAPTFGYSYKFVKPADWVKTRNISLNESLDPPLIDYQDQTGIWLADSTPLYVRYVSTTDGLTPANFPTDYAYYVEAVLAQRIFKKVTGNGEDELIKFERRVVKKALATAKGNDAMDQAVGTYPQGAWASSRGGWGGERGKRGQLIG